VTSDAAGRRLALALLGVLGVLVTLNVIIAAVPGSSLWIGLPAAAGLLALARRWGLSWSDLGLASESWGRGARWGAGALLAVVAVYVVLALIPPTREALLDRRNDLTVEAALVKALLVIPVGTVLLEEVAFRGVLWGMLARARGTTVATVGSAVAFGLWHILSARGLASSNEAVPGVAGDAGVILGTVLFTTLAGLLLAELRRRSGSLLAPIALHWAVNGVGVLASAALWAYQS
jgi:uncharacterized protein